MNRRLLLLAAAVLAVWAAVVLLPSGEKGPAEHSSWPDLTRETVTSVSVSMDQGGYVLSRAKGLWQVHVPGASTTPWADGARIAQFMEFLSRTPPKRDLGTLDKADAGNFGLDSPKAVVEANATTPFTLTLGAVNPSGDGIYALSSRNPGVLLLLDPGYSKQALRPADYFFDLRALDLRPEDVRSLALSRNGTVVWQVSHQDNAYVFDLPRDMAGRSVADSEMRLYLHTLSGLRAQSLILDQARVVPDSEATPPALGVEIRTKGGGSSQRVEAWNVAGQAEMVGRSTFQPSAFSLEPDRVKYLVRSAFEMLDRSVVRFETSAVSRLVVRMGDRTLEATRTGNAWKGDGGGELQGIDMSLWRLKDTRFESEPRAELPASAVASASFELFDDKGRSLLTATFSSDPALPEGQAWLTVSGDGRAYPVSAQLAQDVQGLIPARK